MDKDRDKATYKATRRKVRKKRSENSAVHLGTPRWHCRVSLRRMQMTAQVGTPLCTCLTFDAVYCAPYSPVVRSTEEKGLKRRLPSILLYACAYVVHGSSSPPHPSLFAHQTDAISFLISGTVYIPRVFYFPVYRRCPRVRTFYQHCVGREGQP